MNEAFIQIVAIHFLTFTDFVPDLELQQSIGFVMVGFILINILINLYFVLSAGLKSQLLVIQKYWLRLKRALGLIPPSNH